MSRIFISWSKENSKSHRMAEILFNWIPEVLQSVECYMSSHSIDKGIRWRQSLDKELEESSFGIICVTKESLSSAWLNFEAGVLSKGIFNSYVVPFLLDLEKNDITGPLSQFQAVTFDERDIKKLVKTMHKALCSKVKKKTVLKNFKREYKNLKEKLEELKNNDLAPKNIFHCIQDIRRKPILLEYNPSLWIPLETNFCDLITYQNCQTNIFPNVSIFGDTIQKVEFIHNKGYRFNGKNMISVHMKDELPAKREARTFIFGMYPTDIPDENPMFLFSYGQRMTHKCGDGINNHDKSFGIFWGEPQPDEEIEDEFKGQGLRIFFYCEHCKEDRISNTCDTPIICHINKINKWYIIAVTYDGENLRFYLDGELIFNEKYILKTSRSPYLNIGGFVHHNEDGATIAKDLDYTMHGYLREFMMFRDSLDTNQISNLSSKIRKII